MQIFLNFIGCKPFLVIPLTGGLQTGFLDFQKCNSTVNIVYKFVAICESSNKPNFV